MMKTFWTILFFLHILVSPVYSLDTLDHILTEHNYMINNEDQSNSPHPKDHSHELQKELFSLDINSSNPNKNLPISPIVLADNRVLNWPEVHDRIELYDYHQKTNFPSPNKYRNLPLLN